MSVAAAGGAVSTQLHQPTAEQIRLAQLIDDKKHDRNEVQEIIGKVLDVATNSTTDDVLLALYDCDYDCEKAVALLIEKGHEVASEWRTATNHKTSKKQQQQQQQQKTVGTKNGHGDMNENGQQRGYNGQTSRGGKSRRFQQNGGDSQPNNNNNQQQQQQQPSQQQSNDNYNPQQRQRGGFRGRFRGSNRGGHRTTDRNYQQQTQNEDLNLDNLSMSDTNRRTRGPNVSSGQQQQTQQQQQDQWDVGNWNGETLIYSRTAKEEEQSSLPPPPPLSSSTFEQTPKGLNGQSDAKNQVQSSTGSFDPVEAARQIKNVIGIGQASKPLTIDQQQQQQQKSKVTGQSLNTKLTPPLTQARIPQQPVIFTDHFDSGVNKLDIQFGNLDDSSSVSTSMFYQQQKQADSISSNKLSQRATVPEQTTAHISPSTRPNEQPVMNTQRVLPTQLQQQQQPPSMTMKPVVTPQYTVHQQQPHQINPQNLLLQSLLYHQQTQQSEPVTLDTSYDPSSFPLPSIDFNSPYFMAAAAPPPQQQTQPRYIVSQGPPPPQQTTAGTKNVQTPAGSASTTSIATKKGPAIPPGMFPPTGPPSIPQQSAYSAAYGVQQQAAGTAYSTSYETEHLFANTFIPLNNAQQTQSPTGTYGSVTPPSQPQQANANSENKTLNYGPPSISENMMLLQQYQQFALQQSNSQQQGQQPGTHSPATLSYYLSHPPSGASYSPGHQIMYAQAATAMSQQQAPKQQNQQYNQTNASTGPTGNNDYYNRNPASTNKDGQYMYTPTNQSQSSTGQQQQQQQQQQGVNKQQRSGGNVYNNQQGHQRPYQ